MFTGQGHQALSGQTWQAYKLITGATQAVGTAAGAAQTTFWGTAAVDFAINLPPGPASYNFNPIGAAAGTATGNVYRWLTK